MHWAGWFFASNIVLYLLVSLNYIPVIPNPYDINIMNWTGATLSWAFLVASFFVQLSLFSFGACSLVILLILVYPRRWLIFPLASFLAGFVAFFLVLDSVVYHLFHFHFAGVVWELLRSGVLTEVVVLSSFEWGIVAALCVGFLVIELALAVYIWKKKNSPALKGYGPILTIFLIVGTIFSYGLMLRSSGIGTKLPINYPYTHQVVMESKIIPFYTDFLGAVLPYRQGAYKLQTAGAGMFIQLKQVTKPLNYPLHPMKCQRKAKPYNIMIIAIDALRFDTMDEKVMPSVYQFSKSSWDFKNNSSGGNATGPGIFSLFYSLPYNYWTAVKAQHQSPVLMDELLKQGYEMGIYRSASMEYPAFNQTVFSAIKNLQIHAKGNKAYIRDRTITNQFKKFLTKHDPNKPFFGFLFYDAVHNYCQQNVSYSQPFQPIVPHCDRMSINASTPVQPYMNRYYNSAHYVDGLIGEVLADLKNRKLLDNTIVVIVSDHGQEFNDSHQLYWGHASGYTRWQIGTPLIIHWPHESHQVLTHKTTHYDVIPLLMQKGLQCENPAEDYSVGKSILVPGNRPYSVANSYIDYAIIQDDRITRIYPQGGFVIDHADGSEMKDAKLDMSTMKAVFAEVKKYFKS